MASGSLSDILALRIRGWELVLSGIARESIERASGTFTRVTQLEAQRFALELPLTVQPERVLADFVARGATLVSLNPIRETLEDLFVEKVAEVSTDRGLPQA